MMGRLGVEEGGWELSGGLCPPGWVDVLNLLYGRGAEIARQ